MSKIYVAVLCSFTLFLCNTSSIARVSTYGFVQSNGTYAEISGGTVLGNTTSDDQYFVSPADPLGTAGATTGIGFPIGFNFTYNGIIFDRFAINNNGWISLGQSSLTPGVSLVTTGAYTPLSTAVNTGCFFINTARRITKKLTPAVKKKPGRICSGHFFLIQKKEISFHLESGWDCQNFYN
jgi:hypothetical protein